jgi:hypothetical protein
VNSEHKVAKNIKIFGLLSLTKNEISDKLKSVNSRDLKSNYTFSA